MATSAPARRKDQRSGKRLLADAGILVALAVMVAVGLRAFVAQAYYIPSVSMVPQLRVNDRVVVSRLAYDLHRPHRGDIIVFSAPPGESTPTPRRNEVSRLLHDAATALGLSSDQTVLIKRVIGLPGETVQGDGGHLYIDGRMLIEPYLPKGTESCAAPPVGACGAFGPYRIAPGKVWVMGDNRGDSMDSRYFGAIPESTVVGRAVWKIWPPPRASFL